MARLSCVLCALLLVAGPASARPAAKVSPQALAQAKAAFKEATAAYDGGHFEEARAGFERAHELSRNPVLYFNLAACDEKLDQTRVAIAHLRSYLAEVPGADDAERVRERIGGLEERARQEDSRHAEELRRAEEDALRAKQLEEQRRLDEQHRRETAAAVVTTPPAAPAPIPLRKRYLGGFVALGLAGGFALLGGGLGISAIRKYDELKSGCGAAGCPDDRIDPVKRQALIADVCYGVAGVAAVATVVLFIVESRGPRTARDRVALSNTGAGVRF